jgi:hypothetical protein
MVKGRRNKVLKLTAAKVKYIIREGVNQKNETVMPG